MNAAYLFAMLVSISLSLSGMAHAHPPAERTVSTMDHTVSAGSDHCDHTVGVAGNGHGHETHSNCTMTACCHTGAPEALTVPVLIGDVSARYIPHANLQLHKAVPDSAKRPPRTT